MTLDIILASASPRRAEILKSIALPFRVIASDFDESTIPYEQNPAEYVKQIAYHKAEFVAEKHPTAVVIAADTVVFLDKKPFGKPPTREDAVAYLTELCGHWHSVFTGVSVVVGSNHVQHYEETKVLFNQLTLEQINKYLDAIHWQDKSGSYAIQGDGGALIVAQINGCFYNVMGLPVNALQYLLVTLGIDLWQFFGRK
ncbi:MAG: nucleoside triphosphate pyrophosphatase [Parachlamydiales bacterium]|jgi:septum formation protein